MVKMHPAAMQQCDATMALQCTFAPTVAPSSATRDVWREEKSLNTNQWSRQRDSMVTAWRYARCTFWYSIFKSMAHSESRPFWLTAPLTRSDWIAGRFFSDKAQPSRISIELVVSPDHYKKSWNSNGNPSVVDHRKHVSIQTFPVWGSRSTFKYAGEWNDINSLFARIS
jgi:hypothetical protein